MTTTPLILVLGTTNAGKFREFAELLGELPCELRSLAGFDAAREPDESGASLAENARIKAVAYARATGCWTLADDTGLFVDALRGEPGLHTARYAGTAADARANRAKLLAALDGIPLARRMARFECALALADARGAIRAETTGICRGRIGVAESGGSGFGYDPLFELPEYHLTFAELGAAAKNRLSHRGRAIEALRPWLVQVAKVPSMEST
ncbi:MAG: RdgB/HAM1 family non-canonical purine NTP pyrophosphatase [Pirellulales bacterium]|nr:RdgB/HAM1 family non-canonical purine NTP pyrophosphatase [Pirellulales bacterium]